ncbi:MAG: AsnC family transcriptional regulator [Candidatus Marinimicrobia bacterium]|nr:AsnC family transcriptional regulator [Candidatus Neomarinimicrobiota bacterium]|tara:strand:- start:13332 stop:13787 length:456 start_codon:yes stop_codon:yes gene_type:complete
MAIIDDIDREILITLQREGRKTASQIADELNLTVPTITERIRKLENGFVIKAFQAIIDPRSVGLDVTAFITVIPSSSENYKELIKKAKETSEVIQCFSTTGVGSLMLWIATHNSQSLEELLRNIQRWPNVARTETQVILSSYKTVQQLPIR